MLTDEDVVYLKIAMKESLKSRDPSTKVGAVLLFESGNGFNTAHNNFLADIDPATATREERYNWVVHAELMVILGAKDELVGCTLYSSEEPCLECTKAIITAGIERVVFYSTTSERRDRWGCAKGAQLLRWHNVERLEVARP